MIFLNKKQLFITLILSIITCGIWAQLPQVSFIVTGNQSSETKNYLAQKYVALKPPFRFTASTAKSFTAKINPAVVMAPPPVVAPTPPSRPKEIKIGDVILYNSGGYIVY